MPCPLFCVLPGLKRADRREEGGVAREVPCYVAVGRGEGFDGARVGARGGGWLWLRLRRGMGLGGLWGWVCAEGLGLRLGVEGLWWEGLLLLLWRVRLLEEGGIEGGQDAGEIGLYVGHVWVFV